jgi:hypothetical protein
MTIDFDLKGKIYTDIVPKQALNCRIMTTSHLIEGEVHVRTSGRIKDELDNPEAFLPVTHAVVLGPARQVLFRTAFIAVRRDQVIWITPLDEIHEEESSC